MAPAHCVLDNKGNKYTNSNCVILIVFPLQQWLHERTSMLRYMYIACHVEYMVSASTNLYATFLLSAYNEFLFKIYTCPSVCMYYPSRLDTDQILMMIILFYGITNVTMCSEVLFLCKSTLHVSGGTHAHHQEYNLNCINIHWYNYSRSQIVSVTSSQHSLARSA